jgi:hypothetical protein
MNMRITYIEEIETTLLILFGRILGFIEGKGRWRAYQPLFYDFSLRIHKLLNYQLPISSTFKFVRSRRDPKEKNYRDRSRQLCCYFWFLGVRRCLS